MSAEAWLSMYSETPEQPGPSGAGNAPFAAGFAGVAEGVAPRPLEEDERVELWLLMPEARAGDSGNATDSANVAEAGHSEDTPDASGAAGLADHASDAPHGAAPITRFGNYAADTDIGQLDIDGWDVRPAQVAGISMRSLASAPFAPSQPSGLGAPDTTSSSLDGAYIALAAGGWGLSGAPGTPSAPGARAIVRRVDHEGIAEWDGVIAATGAEHIESAQSAQGVQRAEGAGSPVATLPGASGASGASSPDTLPQFPHAIVRSSETVLVLRLSGEGRLYQRRRSPRLSVRLSPVRLVPMSTDVSSPARPISLSAHRALVEDADFAPVARLSDVSATGAAVVVDTPLETGTTVALEFELPGEAAPFTVRGRVVEPAIALHGESQPQPDGLPGFRRGIEFLGHAAGRESRRLASVLSRLLQR